MSYVRYTKAVDRLYHNLDEMIAQGLFEKKKVYMFGSSKLCGMIVYYLQQHQIDMAGIIDNNPKTQGTHFLGLTIEAPALLADKNHDEILILIASGYQDAMIEQMEQLGYRYGQSIVKVIDLPEVMSDYSFAKRSGYEPMTWEEIKHRQMEALRCVKRVCERHGFRYYLAYGTLIGAVRHQGYIPWDDDIDVYININDFDRFIRAVQEEDNFEVASIANHPEYYDIIGMLYDKNSVCDTNHFPMQVSAGVSIDLFVLFGLPDTKEELELYYSELKAAELHMLNCMYDGEKRIQAQRAYYKLLKKYDVDRAKYIGHIMGPWNLKEVYDASYFGTGVQLSFEGDTFCAPKEYDACLKAVYGDYMQLPPERERLRKHFFHAYRQYQVAFRVDANGNIASGHLMRCLTIAAECRKMGMECIFLMAQEQETERLKAQGFAYRILNSDWRDLKEEVPATKELLKKYGTAWLVVDTYQAESAYLEQMNDAVKVLYVDDMGTVKYPVRAVLHYGLCPDMMQYEEKYRDTKTQVLAGTRYVPLRGEFQPPSQKQDRKKAVLITTGGTDPHHIAERVLAKCLTSDRLRDYEYFVIVGSMCDNLPRLQKRIGEAESSRQCRIGQVHLLQNVNHMGELMRECELAVSAGGTTLYELCACGTPTVCFSFADNQLSTTREMGRSGIMLYAGDARAIAVEDVIVGDLERLAGSPQLRKVYSEKMINLVDGRGGERIATFLAGRMEKQGKRA